MRSLVLFTVWLVAGCQQQSELAAVDDGGGSGGSGLSAPQCLEDTDCAMAAATCCDCPGFAVDANDPTILACTGVSCPSQTACPQNVRAACDQGACVLACVELACPTTCVDGYAIDPTGCLSCACAVPEPGGCVADTDCVVTRADCCGCAQGGVDTAVLASELAGFEDTLGCGPSPACPAVGVCTPGAAPRCVQGRCELLSAADLPENACGRADLAACPLDQRCTVNRSALATAQGVGVCVPR